MASLDQVVQRKRRLAPAAPDGGGGHDVVGFGQLAQVLLPALDELCQLRLVAVARHDEELVAAVAVAVDALVGDGPDAVGHQFQQGVSPAVALRVVHGLQVVDVEEQHAA